MILESYIHLESIYAIICVSGILRNWKNMTAKRADKETKTE